MTLAGHGTVSGVLAQDLRFTMSFLDDHALNEAERRERQRFLGITDLDKANVRELQAAFAAHAQTFAEQFYQHLLAHPQTAALLRDPQQLERLKTIQATYFADLLSGVFDETYYEGRLRVGLAHQRAGLEPVWYLGAYNQYIQLAFPVFVRAFGENLEQVLPLLLSLIKVIFLDMGLALQTYFHQATEGLRQHNTELQQALQLYWQTQRREEQLRKLLSHEVRGGLAAVITSLEDLQDVAGSGLEPEAADQLAHVTKRCWSLTNLLTEMLAAGQQSGGATWVETAQVFEHLVARFGLYAEGRIIHLRLPGHAPRVWADPIQLREVFANLILNAVRYLDKEPGLVDITCRPEGDFYLFCVADNGPGIPASIKERIFEPFVRGPTTPGKPEGTGLGLYFVRTVIEQGHGQVWVESEPGQGSRFWFTVPRVPPTSAPAQKCPAPSPERY